MLFLLLLVLLLLLLLLVLTLLLLLLTLLLTLLLLLQLAVVLVLLVLVLLLLNERLVLVLGFGLRVQLLLVYSLRWINVPPFVRLLQKTGLQRLPQKLPECRCSCGWRNHINVRISLSFAVLYIFLKNRNKIKCCFRISGRYVRHCG